MTIEIVDLPIEKGGSFHSYVNVYQRVANEVNQGMSGIHQARWMNNLFVRYGIKARFFECSIWNSSCIARDRSLPSGKR